jgi:putative chitinase
LRLAHFLAQCSHESISFTCTTESLNYKTASRLRLIFPKYFQTEQEAEQFLGNAEKLGNRVYSGRMGNGSEASGDGFRFIGRGFIQTTGRNNYQCFADYIGDQAIMENPGLVAEKYALDSALYYWEARKVNAVADRGADEETVKAVTRIVNGGYNGLADRIHRFH